MIYELNDNDKKELGNPQEFPKGYETDLLAVGVRRMASPPDGVDQDWTELHPNGAAHVTS